MFRLLFFICIVALITFFIFGNYNAKKEGASPASKVLFGLAWILGFVILAFFVHNSEQLGLTIAAEIGLLITHLICGSVNIFMHWHNINRDAIAYVNKNKKELEFDFKNHLQKQENLSWNEWLIAEGFRPTAADNINILAARGMFWFWFLFVWFLELLWNVATGTGKRIYSVYQRITQIYGKALTKQSDTMWDEENKKK